MTSSLWDLMFFTDIFCYPVNESDPEGFNKTNPDPQHCRYGTTRPNKHGRVFLVPCRE